MDQLMAKYDVYINYARRDGTEIARAIAGLLKEKGISVFFDVESLRVGSNFVDQIAESISACEYFIPVITDSYNHSLYAMDELTFALSLSRDRSKKILPVIETDTMSSELELMLCNYQCFPANDLEALIETICAILSENSAVEKLYEKLAEYSKLKSSDKEAETICELVDLLLERFRAEESDEKRRKTCIELHRLYSRLTKYAGGYDAESRKTVDRILKTLNRLSIDLKTGADTEDVNIFVDDLFFSAFAVQMVYLDREIRSECADVITSGVVRNPCPVETYAEKQKPFVDAFRRLYSTKSEKTESYTDEELTLISETPKYFLDPGTVSDMSRQSRPKKTNQAASLSKDDEILISIAHFMQEGNKLFDALQQKRIEGSFLKCLLTSYERLKAYCQIVGADDVAAQCVDRIVEIRGFVDKQENSVATDDKAEKGIRSLLGFTLHGSGNYDVFISFKNEDSDMAESIYKYCQKHLKEPFWSKKSLPELSKSEYEDAIFDALRRSKHFIIVLSNLEYLKANWVKKEMAIFDRAITEGRKTDANFVFVVTDGVYREIIDSKKMCLDERYCGYQIIKMSEYESVLYKYLT